MKERTKEILRDGFGSLINNSAALRGGKNGPLWLTILFFIFSIILPIVPIFVSQANIKGSSFLNTYSYSLEKNVTAVALTLKDRNVELVLSEEHLLTIKENGNQIDYSIYGSDKPFAVYENSVTKQYDFVLYVSDASKASEQKVVNTAINAKTYTLGSTTASAAAEGSYTPSYMVLYPNSLSVVIYGNNATKAVASSYAGDYKTMKATANGLTYLLSVNDKDGNAITHENISEWLIDEQYTAGVLANFKRIMNKSYDTLKIKNTWGSSGIYLAIFFGLSVLMGFLMWILTRGKNNPNNYFSPWLTQKIEARLALTPALLTLIIGFFLVQYAPMIFILTLGLRVMWISMKELRPVQA